MSLARGGTEGEREQGDTRMYNTHINNSALRRTFCVIRGHFSRVETRAAPCGNAIPGRE